MAGAFSTRVITVAVLFARFRSRSRALTVAEFVIVPAKVEATTTVTAALEPLAKLPRAQVMTPLERAQLPCVERAEIKFTLAGKGALKLTLVAVAGPPLVTKTV